MTSYRKSFVPIANSVQRKTKHYTRASRDSRWSAIKAAPHELLALAPDYERNVSQADGLSDSRLDKLQHEADRQSKAQRLELLEQEFEGLHAGAGF